MNELSVYWSSVEFLYEADSAKKENLKGGFVYCFVNAFDARDAIEKIERDLKSQSMGIKKVDFVSVYDENMEWETAKQTKHFIQLHGEAKNVSQVVFDDFYAYEEE